MCDLTYLLWYPQVPVSFWLVHAILSFSSSSPSIDYNASSRFPHIHFFTPPPSLSNTVSPPPSLSDTVSFNHHISLCSQSAAKYRQLRNLHLSSDFNLQKKVHELDLSSLPQHLMLHNEHAYRFLALNSQGKVFFGRWPQVWQLLQLKGEASNEGYLQKSLILQKAGKICFHLNAWISSYDIDWSLLCSSL